MDAGALNNRVDAVRRKVLKRFDRAVGPADFRRFHLLGRAEAEVETQVVLREIAAAPTDFAELLYTCGVNRDTRANRGAIALGPDELEEDAMVAVRIHVFEERGRFADV